MAVTRRDVGRRLKEAVEAVVPGTQVSIGAFGDSASVRTTPAATPAVQAVIDAFDWSDAAQDLWEHSKQRAAAKAAIDKVDDLERLVRAVVKRVVSEDNRFADWITQFKAATAASSTLANFKSGVAALPDTPDRTYAQARTALMNDIDGEPD